MPVVETIRDLCKRCYACVRHCPSKAIRIENGQAMVIQDRCIGCGNCVRVCSQNAKAVQSGIEETQKILTSNAQKIAILAPSFPAAFHDQDPLRVVGALHKLGFDRVVQVAVGADALALKYAELAVEKSMIISTPCPAVVYYIQKYHPDLLPYLAPLVSPMIATASIARATYHKTAKVVFIGPCITKKKEMMDPNVKGIIDQVLIFDELLQLFEMHSVVIKECPEQKFDPPQPRLGGVFPISGGLLLAAGLEQDILQNEINVTEGSERVINILQRIKEGNLEERFYDLLFCEGCVNGPGMMNELSYFARKDIVVNFVKNHLRRNTQENVYSPTFKIPLSREYQSEAISFPQPSEKEIKEIFARIHKFEPKDQLDCGACGYSSCRDKAIAVYQGIAEVEMCLPYLIERLETINKELINAQQKAVRTVQLATMGKMSTKIAHEINNSLSGVLNYMIFMQKLLNSESFDLARFRKYLVTMEKEIFRMSEFVKGLLVFANAKDPDLQNVSVTEIIEKSIKNVTSQISLENIDIHKEFENKDLCIKADVRQMQQVFTNMMINSVQAMPKGGSITIRAKRSSEIGFVVIELVDTGFGIPPEHKDKIFDPFFTTNNFQKKNIGLGLSTAYSVVLLHDGDIKVESQDDKGTKIIIKLPEYQQ